jgi:hypothetical protein
MFGQLSERQELERFSVMNNEIEAMSAHFCTLAETVHTAVNLGSTIALPSHQ